MSVKLRQFSRQEIKINQESAYRILRFFFPDMTLKPNELTQDDIAFAQALLVEAIDSSYHLGFVEHLFDAFYMKVPINFTSIKDMVKNFAKTEARHWVKHATQKDLENPLIYENVRLALAQNFRSAWKVREQIGEIIY